MKRALVLLSICAAFSCSGQGIVELGSGTSPAAREATNSVLGGPSTGYINGPAGSFYFALFVAPSTVTAFSGWNPTVSGFEFTGKIGTNSIPGRFTGEHWPQAISIEGYAPGSTGSFTVAAWSAALGNTWAQAEASMNSGRFPATGLGFFGNSGVARVQLGGGLLPPGRVFGLNPGQVPGFTLSLLPGSVAAVPEPRPFALAGLGAAALLIFRRRK